MGSKDSQVRERERIVHFADRIGSVRLGRELALPPNVIEDNEDRGTFGNVTIIIDPLADLDGLGEGPAIEEEEESIRGNQP